MFNIINFHFHLPQAGQQEDPSAQHNPSMSFFIPFLVLPMQSDGNPMDLNDILTHSFYQHQQEAQKMRPKAKKDAITHLPQFRYTLDRESYLKQYNNHTCTVCCDEYHLNDEILMLPCQHAFHSECIKPWLEQHANTCPICRYELPVDDPAKEFERKQRMIERFSQSGLEIIELSAEVDSYYQKILDAKQLYEQRLHVESLTKSDITQLLHDLQHIEISLENITLKLDKISEFKDERSKEQRKNCILKIQQLESIIDNLKSSCNKQILSFL